MKILWITNIMLHCVANKLKLQESVYGGWLDGLSKELVASGKLNLYLIFPSERNKDTKGESGGIKYFEMSKKSISNLSLLKEIDKSIEPDIVHIHGTELIYGRNYISANPSRKFIVSIQGLISVYSKHYFAGISLGTIIKNITLRDVLRLDTLFHQKRKFIKRGANEIEILKLTKHIIGRTDWDKANVLVQNSKVSYYHCDEILRDKFYDLDNNWNYKNIEKYSIYVSQGNYPIKGLHYLIKAIALLKGEYPLMKVRIGGYDPTLQNSSILGGLRLSGYGAIIKREIKNLNLEDNIIFLGERSKDQVINELKKAHIFVCPSVIENSPNALCEAQILGVPNISTYCGGIPSMLKEASSTLFVPFDDEIMLAYYIKWLFNNSSECIKRSYNSKLAATRRHDRSLIVKDMLNIYDIVANSEE